MAEEMNIKLKLYWDEDKGKFMPMSEEGIHSYVFLDLIEDNENKHWQYYYIEDAPLIARRTALRSARGIAKTGYVHPEENKRYGVRYDLKEEFDQYEHLSDDLKKSQRSWYGGHYKEYK
ncbi:MAG: hypothetical protein ACTSR8_15540 [Promethearchaeota archaeon]